MEDSWEFLRPLCAPLQGLLSIRTSPTVRIPAISVVGLELSLSPSRSLAGASKARELREAMLLVSMVARASRKALIRVLFELCGVDRKKIPEEYMEADCLYDGAFTVRISQAKHMMPNQADWVEGLLSPLFSELDTPPSAEFSAAADKIASQVGRPLLHVDVPVRIVLDQPWDDYERGFALLMDLHASHGGWCFPVNRGERSCAFVLEPMEWYFFTVEMTQGDAELLGKLARPSVMPPVSHLELSGQYRRTGAEVRAYSDLMAALLGLDGMSSARIPSLSICWSIADHTEGVGRLCSALAETRAVDAVTLRFSEFDEEEGYQDFVQHTDRERTTSRVAPWGYIAHAFFSDQARARSSVSSLTLFDVILDEEDANEFADILTADDPISLLYGWHVGFDGSGTRPRADPGVGRFPTRAMLAQGTTVAILQMHADERFLPGMCRLQSNVVGVQLLESADLGDASIVPALVPGFGVCLVARQDLHFLEDDDDDSSLASGSITCLDIDFDGHDREADQATGLLHFLKLVGLPLTRLRLGMSPTMDVNIAGILQCCPNLETLIIRGANVDTSAFLQTYRSCAMQISEIDCRFDDLNEIGSELSDGTTKLARTLKRMSFAMDQFSNYQSAYLQTIQSMLEKNQTLEYFELTASTDLVKSNSAAIDSLLLERKWLPGACKRFPLSCRLAFISVLDASRREHERAAKRLKRDPVAVSSVLAQFPVDRHLLKRIFDFAAEPAHRRVYVNEWKHSWRNRMANCKFEDGFE